MQRSIAFLWVRGILFIQYLVILAKQEVIGFFFYFRAAFFAGQIIHPRNKILVKFFGYPEDPVYVAINMDGVFIIDMDDVIFLLGILYKDLEWEVAEKEEDNQRESCIFLQFDFKEAGRTEELKKLLQIFSKEAMLMDSLISASMQKRREWGDADDEGWKDDNDDYGE